MVFRVFVKNREVTLHNLNQVYGFLIGVFPGYREHHPSMKFFKKWYLARRRRGLTTHNYQFGNSSFCLEQITPYPRPVPHSET